MPKNPHRELVGIKFAEQGGKCFYCSRLMRKPGRGKGWSTQATLDHYIPIARGGVHEPGNTVAACAQCNNEKGNMMPEDFTPSVEPTTPARRMEGRDG